MFHKNAANSSSNLGPTLVPSTKLMHSARLSPAAKLNGPQQQSWFDLELVRVASRRCSSFFAEAAVLVLVFGNLKGRVELRWISGIFVASLTLLAASILTEARAQRWIDAHP